MCCTAVQAARGPADATHGERWLLGSAKHKSDARAVLTVVLAGAVYAGGSLAKRMEG